MKITQSPLEILDFAVLNFELKFVPPQSTDEIPQSYYDKYDIDLDFNVNTNDFLRVFIKTSINKNELPGYKISAEVACIFRLNENFPLSDTEKNNIQRYSSIYIALNTLRGIISQFTANAPIGRYVFPSIDLNSLIEEKQKIYEVKEVHEQNTVKPKRKKSIKTVEKRKKQE